MIKNAEKREQFRIALLAAPAAVLMLCVFALPLVGIFLESFSSTDGSAWSVRAYVKIFTTPLFYRVAYTTLQISVGATLLSFILAYPIAYFLSKLAPRQRALVMVFILVPFWTSSLVKSFSFMVLLGESGLVNQILVGIGIGPVKMLYNRFGVLVGMSHYLIPFMVFPILSSLMNQPKELARAAAIMGASKLLIFRRVTFPLSLPGVMAGALLTFILSLGFYTIPALLGGVKDMMLSNLVNFYIREVIDWPMACAVGMMLVIASLCVAIMLSKIKGGASILSSEDA